MFFLLRSVRSLRSGSKTGADTEGSKTVRAEQCKKQDCRRSTRAQGATREEVKSPEWRDAFFDILAAAYRNIFLPFVSGELKGKLNLPADYATDNDLSLMNALAPEWSEGTAATLGSSNQFVEWFHKNYTLTIPEDWPVYREPDGTLHRDFLKAQRQGNGIINENNYSLKFAAHKDKNWYKERGVGRHPIPVVYGEAHEEHDQRERMNSIKTDKFIEKFTKECPAATDFLRYRSNNEKMKRVLTLIPRLGLVMLSGNNYRFFGYRRREEDDVAYVPLEPDEMDEMSASATARYNASTQVDDAKLHRYLVRTLVDLQTEDIANVAKVSSAAEVAEAEEDAEAEEPLVPETLEQTVSHPDVWTIVTKENKHHVCDVNDTFDLTQGSTQHLAARIDKLSGEVTQAFKKGKTKVSVNGEEIGSIVPALADDGVVIISGTSKDSKNRKVVYFKNGQEVWLSVLAYDWIAAGRPRNPTTIVEGSHEVTSSDSGVAEAPDEVGAGVGLSAIAPHTYTDVNPMFTIDKDNVWDYVDLLDVGDNTTQATASEYGYKVDDASSDSCGYDADAQLAAYVDEWLKDADVFWIGLDNVPCVVLGQVPSVDEVKLAIKIMKKLENKKCTDRTTGLVTAEPTLSAIEYLNRMKEKYYWRVFGPNVDHEFDPKFDLGSDDTHPQFSFPGAYERYGSINIFGADSIVSAKIGRTKFDLRCVDPEQSFITWRGDKKELFETIRHKYDKIKWEYNGERV